MFSSGGLGFTIGPAILIAAVLTLAPVVAAAFFSREFAAWVQRLPSLLRLLCPAILCVPYVLVASSLRVLCWEWIALYALLPVAIAGLLWQARQADHAQLGDWRDFVVLGLLGLAVDLR
ncbi:MAG TPA: CPBP family intramembrane glutamate endopeptidase, partial [Acidobacteriaceae bacterium]